MFALALQLKVECATLQERLDLAQAGVSQDDAGTKLDKALADKAEAEGEAARLKSMVGQYVAMVLRSFVCWSVAIIYVEIPSP